MPRVELLEDRRVPTAFTVRNLNDAGVDSLRAAIQGANASPDAHSSIVFQPMLRGIITLESALDPLQKDIDISGRSGGGAITVERDTNAPNFRIFEVGADSHSDISGLQIMNGIAPTGGLGGGIRNNGNLTIVSCDIRGNSADFGGGIYNSSNATLVVSASNLSFNIAQHAGGGLDNSGQAQINYNSIVSFNVADFGGGVSNDGTLGIYDDSQILGNDANLRGGGIYNALGCSLSMSSGEIRGNETTVQGGQGGGVYNGGTATLRSVNITGNWASSGGGFYLANGALTLDGCTISGNTATVKGAGGVWLAGSTLTTINCTILDAIVQGP